MSIKNINLITEKIYETNFNQINFKDNVDEKWLTLKEQLIEIIDKIAPVKKIHQNKQTKFPWVDLELLELKKTRDKLHKRFMKTENKYDFEKFDEAKQNYNQMNRFKMIDYFKSHTMNDIKNTKKFWQFYATTIKLKSSDKKNNILKSSYVTDGISFAQDKQSVADLFNLFFTSLSSESTSTDDVCYEFSNKLFDENSLVIEDKFALKYVNNSIVEQLINDLASSSGPGIAGISSKIFKAASLVLTPILTTLFNDCVKTMKIPSEWKCAIVTPIYKQKGQVEDVNNYRGISDISPIVKLFENMLAMQIIEYVNKEKILFDGQHGFRNNHSCETALHELITDMNKIRSNRESCYLQHNRSSFQYRKAVFLVHFSFYFSSMIWQSISSQ